MFDKKEYDKNYYQEHKEEHDKTTKDWSKTHPDYQKDFYAKNREREIKEACDYQKNNPEKVQKNHSIWHHNRRVRAFEKLGGKCVHCGETDFRCLQIDHINGGGSKHFEQRGTINLLSDVLKDPDAKSKYQLLCANCNWKKRYDNKEHGGHPKQP